MDKICNFDIVINTCLAEINPASVMPDFDKNGFLLSVINGFEDGAWRKKVFRQFVLDNIAQTGLSAEDRDNLYCESPYTTLTESVKNLRLVDTDNGQGSEIAEIVLYGIMRYYYGALPVVPKIFYKQNTNDNAKGADSVHIVLDDKGDFTLWLGEAKFYSNIANERMYENSIITSISDLQYVIPNPDTRKFVQTILRRETSVDEIRKRLHIPILLLHECDKTQKATELSETYLGEIKRYHLDRAINYFNIQNGKQKKQNVHGYDNIQFHLILFPVPNKNEIVNWFVERAKQIKEDA